METLVHMKSAGKGFLLVLWLAVMLLPFIGSCSAVAGKNRLMTKPLTERDLQGKADLILYGGNYYHDLETIALVDIAGDPYAFEIYAPDFVYKVVKGLSAKDALSDAEKFLRHQTSLQSIRLSRIVNDQGTVVGYEIRPLYYPFRYGFSDVLDVGYVQKGNKVVVTVRVDRSVERKMHDGNGIIKVN